MNEYQDHRILLLYNQLFQNLHNESSNNESKNKNESILLLNTNNNINPSNPNIKYNGNPLPSEYISKSYAKLQSGLYNQPKEDDAGDNDVPFRYMKYYYVYNNKNKKSTKDNTTTMVERIPLPIDSSIKVSKLKDIVIAGWVQPATTNNNDNNNETEVEPIFVVLDNITNHVVIDRFSASRGYWIETTIKKTKDIAWYYLQDPCDYKPTTKSSIVLESQLEIQLDANIILACVSLLFHKIVDDDDPTIIVRSIQDLLKQSTLLVIHNDMNNNDNMNNNDISIEQKVNDLYDFEIQIFTIYKKYIVQHLNGCVEACTNNCTLLKSIFALSTKKAIKTVSSTSKTMKYNLNVWLQLVCIQLQQYPWGGPIINMDDLYKGLYIDQHTINNNNNNNVKNKNIVKRNHEETVVNHDDDDNDEEVPLVNTKKRKSTSNVKRESIIYDDDDNDDDDHNNNNKDNNTKLVSEQAQSLNNKSNNIMYKNNNKDKFSAIVLKAILIENASIIPYIKCNVKKEDWDDNTTWESINNNNNNNNTSQAFTIANDETEKEFFNCLSKTTKLPLEYLLLITYVLNYVPAKSKYAKSLFQNNKENNIRPITYIFNDVFDRTIQIINEKVEQGISIENTTSMYLLATIMLLITNRSEINDKNKLNSLREKAKVDWKACVDKVSECINKMNKKSMTVPNYLNSCFTSANHKISQIILNVPDVTTTKEASRPISDTIGQNNMKINEMKTSNLPKDDSCNNMDIKIKKKERISNGGAATATQSLVSRTDRPKSFLSNFLKRSSVPGNSEEKNDIQKSITITNSIYSIDKLLENNNNEIPDAENKKQSGRVPLGKIGSSSFEYNTKSCEWKDTSWGDETEEPQKKRHGDFT